MNPEGRTAIVTGGAIRLGKAIALGLAARGTNLVIHYHSSASEAENTAEECRALGVEVATIQADLSQTEGITGLYHRFDQLEIPLDVLINSAAVMLPTNLLEASPADWSRTVDLNLRGAFFTLQGAAQRMGAQGGVIVNISDVAGLKPWPRYPIHSISKAGVEMLTRVSALALAPRIRVNAVAPGPVIKPDRMSPERWAEIGAELPLGQAGEGEAVVHAVLSLIENDFITGETLVVDGGDQLT
jgi:NAD(P)-dependent dehydrogenase (short-subunit alcohol dehydrogenase family)